ncbi:hypothetical protein [Streptomyces cinerochromogenes]|uniref:hypothetical protein n=1 Tax=Streptomyces cinerochromogenes TaxID=66422 RepID=UPI0033BBD0D8
MNVDPSVEEIERFVAEDPEAPVVMLNLLRFKKGGAEKYADYLRAAQPFAEAAGVQIVYYGLGSTPLVGDSVQGWDAVAIVSYPSRRAFAGMVSQPGYPIALREDALVETVLQPTTDAAAVYQSAGPDVESG